MMSVNIAGREQKQVSNIEQFEALFNYATIGIIVTNSEGRIINFNKFAEKQFGFSKDEVLEKTVEVLIPPSAREKHVQYRQDYNSSPEVRAMGHGRDLFGQKKDGSTFPVEVSLSNYTINGHNFVIAFVVDITVRKKQEEVVLEQKQELEIVTGEIKSMNSELEQKVSDRTKMLREALAELEKSKEELSEAFENEKELSELKSRFVTMASHEFRTPLSTILSSAYLMEKYNQANPNEKFEKHIHRIKGAVGVMKGILEDFLSLGKLEEGLVQTKMETISTSAFLEDIHALLQEMDALLRPGQKIHFNNTINTPVWVDRNLLKNVLINLISNSIKFTNENSTITVSAYLTNDNLVIAVIDNGIGISQEDQQHLFERFFRAKNASNIQGTGLGLHIVSKYLELMNGRIELRSKLNEGTTVTIHIPQNNHLKEIYEKNIDNRR
ncbi:PAS domain-containing sensor histidine kinase [Segetibacter koreensis]|uniref:sensor histidine kinase n=1 Tax=Segetibacter koreensis TaxID=398037 RepID=UPI0003A87D8E|nr:PAS domain-containing sensor histidine kinase [Segetibacter koreensis]